jgi:hypothetical protein
MRFFEDRRRGPQFESPKSPGIKAERSPASVIARTNSVGKRSRSKARQYSPRTQPANRVADFGKSVVFELGLGLTAAMRVIISARQNAIA